MKNGTEAVVTLYDPQGMGSDTASVYVLKGPDAEKHGWILGHWMHKL